LRLPPPVSILFFSSSAKVFPFNVPDASLRRFVV
jgi:hypothetical protein